MKLLREHWLLQPYPFNLNLTIFQERRLDVEKGRKREKQEIGTSLDPNVVSSTIKSKDNRDVTMCISGQWVSCALDSCDQPQPGGGSSHPTTLRLVGQNIMEIDSQNSGEIHNTCNNV